MLVEVLIENNDRVQPTVPDLGEWADTYKMTFPVLQEEEGEGNFWLYSDGGLPTKVLLDHGSAIDISHKDFNEPEIEDLLSKYN